MPSDASPGATREIRELCIEGDSACTRGDLDALRDILQRIAELDSEPLRCQLVELWIACITASSRTPALWARLEERLRSIAGSAAVVEHRQPRHRDLAGPPSPRPSVLRFRAGGGA